jgi:hypothetical protein
MDYRDAKQSLEAAEQRAREERLGVERERADLASSIAETTTPPAVALGRVAWTVLGMVLFGLTFMGTCAAIGRF